MRSNTMDAATLEDSLTEKNIYAGAKKIQGNPAFHRLEICTSSGIAKRARQFPAKVESDPSIISDLHKEYMHNLQNLALVDIILPKRPDMLDHVYDVMLKK